MNGIKNKLVLSQEIRLKIRVLEYINILYHAVNILDEKELRKLLESLKNTNI